MGHSERIIFFDGVCNLCNGFVDYLVRKHGREMKTASMRFASLQGETAQKVLGEKARELKSILFWDEGVLYAASDAVAKIFQYFEMPIYLFWVPRLGMFPRWIRERVYDWVAENRYRFFGKRDSCRLPTPEEREFFLN